MKRLFVSLLFAFFAYGAWAASVTVNALGTSLPLPAGPGSKVTLFPSGGTARVEYTTGSLSDIGNDVATWSIWPGGTVSVMTADTAAFQMFVRAIGVTGSATLKVDAADPTSIWYRSSIPWASSQGGGGGVTSVTCSAPFACSPSTGAAVFSWTGATLTGTPAAGDMSYWTGANTEGLITNASGGANKALFWASSAAPTWTQMAVIQTNGGNVVLGDILLGTSTANTYNSLADVATGNAIISGGVGAAPSYGKIGLTTHVSGVLPLANGGTNCAAPFPVLPKTATYQVLAADFTCFTTISVASGTFTITLVASGTQPAAGTWIKVINYGTGVITIARSGQNINGGTASLTLPAASATSPIAAYITSDGTNYFAYLDNPPGAVIVTNGGNVVLGDILLGSSTANTYTSLAAVAVGNVLVSNGVGANPIYQKGLTGTTTADNAASGVVGEVQSCTVATGSSVSLTTATTANICTINTLPAGDWDCTGVVDFTFGATTSYTNLEGGVTTTSATLGARDTFFDYETAANVPTAGADAAWVIPTSRVNVSSATQIWLVAQATFTVSTLKAYGTLRCRRMR